VALDHTNQLIVISFRGTTSFSNIVADIDLIMVPWDICTLCTAHSGFLNSWTTVKSQVEAALASATQSYPSYKLVATGHSLGGAIATLATADLRKNSGYEISLVRSLSAPNPFPNPH
jgi:predicted lipase